MRNKTYEKLRNSKRGSSILRKPVTECNFCNTICVLFVWMKDRVHLTVIKGISIAIWPCGFNLV